MRAITPLDCAGCGSTWEQCNQHVAKYGRGCCGACYVRDTHCALRDDTSADPRLRTLVENATDEQRDLLERLDDILNFYGVREFRRDLSAELARAQGYPAEEVAEARTP